MTAQTSAGSVPPTTAPEGASGSLPAGEEARCSAEDMLARMRAGDRDAASRFIREYGDLIRRRVRGKMGRGMRRLFDSQEILSTVGRRLDRYIKNGELRADDPPQLWGLVFRMVDAALVDKVRAYKRLQNVEGEDSEFAARALARMREHDERGDGAELELDAAFRALKSDGDRELLAMWLNDMRFPQIAAMLDISPDAARQRWQAIRAHLRRAWLQEPER